MEVWRGSRIVAALVGLASGLAGCSWPGSDATPVAVETHVFDTAEHRIRVVPVVQGLSFPWGMAFLPDGDMLITEKEGRLRLVVDGVLDPEPIRSVPEVRSSGQGALMDVALHPGFARENNWIYFTYSKPEEGGATTALARARFDGTELTQVEDLFVADAVADTDLHFGSRIAFAPDGALFMTVGERNQRDRAQNTTDHAGTVLRLNDDGSAPDDNPFVGQPESRPEIYSYGHRSPQGLTIHPVTGEVWESEHGPRGGDEVNRILPGRNYGWPVITYGREYSGASITDQPWREGMEQPVFYWVPSIAISGLTFYTGDAFPAWRGDLFVGGLAGLQVQRVQPLDEAGAAERETLLRELGLRIRDVLQGPDGLLYVVAESNAAREAGTGAILRIEPAD